MSLPRCWSAAHGFARRPLQGALKLGYAEIEIADVQKLSALADLNPAAH
jgi:hypothetical protein